MNSELFFNISTIHQAHFHARLCTLPCQQSTAIVVGCGVSIRVATEDIQYSKSVLILYHLLIQADTYGQAIKLQRMQYVGVSKGFPGGTETKTNVTNTYTLNFSGKNCLEESCVQVVLGLQVATLLGLVMEGSLYGDSTYTATSLCGCDNFSLQNTGNMFIYLNI